MMNTLVGKERKIALKNILIIAFPIIVQGLVFQLQTLTDKAFLGNLDTRYLSAMGAAQFPFNTTLDSIVAFCTGVTILVAQWVGAKKQDKIIGVVKSSMFYTTLLALVFFILWVFFSKQIFILTRVDKSIMDYSIRYVRICGFYFLFLGADASLQAMLQGLGDTKPIMYSGIIKVVLDIIISWVLVFGHFGFPALNIEGAAIGSVIANMVSFILLLVYCFGVKGKALGLRGGYKDYFIVSPFRASIKLGLPTGIEFLLWNASNLILVSFLNSFSYIATTIYTLTFGIEVIIYMVVNGIAKAALTLIGQKIGERDIFGARSIFTSCMFINLIVVGAGIGVFALFPTQILALFTKETETIQATTPFLIFTAFILLPKSINVIVGGGIRAYGDTKWMLYSQILGSTFVVSCSFILVKVVGLNVVAIYITLLLDEMIRASINYMHYNKYSRVEVANS